MLTDSEGVIVLEPVGVWLRDVDAVRDGVTERLRLCVVDRVLVTVPIKIRQIRALAKSAVIFTLNVVRVAYLVLP